MPDHEAQAFTKVAAGSRSFRATPGPLPTHPDSDMYVAWDIETCPTALESLSARQARRHDILLAREIERSTTESPEAASQKVRSLHPALGWICCIAVVGADDPASPRPAKAYEAASPEFERPMLEQFWNDLGRLPDRVTWITFYGKDFDVEFLLTRTLRHGLRPSRLDVLDRYPYRNVPHCDLAGLWRRNAMGLADVCELLGVDDPKGAMEGSAVAEAVAAGEIARVAEYCKGDALATMQCYALLQPVL